MSVKVERHLPTVWFCGAVAVSAFLIAATALNFVRPAPDLTRLVLAKLTLMGENNAAAWWSGMLLALASLHAFDGYALLRRSEPGAARGWALIAAALLFLSADEVGSLHERLFLAGHALGGGSWLLIPLYGVVLAVLLGCGLILLWSAGGEQRRKVWPIAIGCLLLGSIAPQEFLEHRIELHTDAARAARAAVEEGTELLGILVLLRVAMANTAWSGAGGRPALAALHELRRPLASLGLALAPVLAVATAALADRANGQPANWLAAVAFLAAGLAASRQLFKSGGRTGWSTWGLAGLCCLASVATVAVGPVRVVGLGVFEVSLRMLILGAIALLVCALWVALSRGRNWSYLMGAIVLGALATLPPLLSTNVALTYMLPALLGLILYWVNSGVMQQETKESPAVAKRSRSLGVKGGGSSAKVGSTQEDTPSGGDGMRFGCPAAARFAHDLGRTDDVRRTPKAGSSQR